MQIGGVATMKETDGKQRSDDASMPRHKTGYRPQRQKQR